MKTDKTLLQCYTLLHDSEKSPAELIIKTIA